jgi:hypothetical protein
MTVCLYPFFFFLIIDEVRFDSVVIYGFMGKYAIEICLEMIIIRISALQEAEMRGALC